MPAWPPSELDENIWFELLERVTEMDFPAPDLSEDLKSQPCFFYEIVCISCPFKASLKMGF